MARRALALLVLALTMSHAHPSRADPEPLPEPAAPTPAPSQAPSPTDTNWYGWQILSVDAVAAGILVGTVEESQGSLLHLPWGVPLSLTIYSLGPPIVHLAHGRLGIAIADLGIRLAAPTLSGLVGASIDEAYRPCATDDGDICIPGVFGGSVGVLLGYTAAVALDAALLARESVPVTPGTPDKQARPWIWPAVARDPHRTVVLMEGSF